jgi:hypothetical protein
VNVGWRRPVLLVGLGLGLAASGGASQPSAASARGAELEFPSRTPRWLVAATQRAARGYQDPNATVVDLRLGRFPIVVIRGEFRCSLCDRRASDAPIPTGHYLTLKFDATTHRVHDVGLSPHRPGKISPLCAGDCRARRRIAIDSARQALSDAGVRVTFGRELGRHRCLIHAREASNGAFEADCALTVAFGKGRTIVTYTKTWPGLDRLGRRYSTESPVLTHVWRVLESPDGWVERITSTGDALPA